MNRNLPTPWRAVVRGVLALALAGCAHSSDKEAQAPAQGEVLVPWTVRIGSQGGFTGGGSGHLVHSDGMVQSWSQVVPGDSVALQTVGHADPKALHELLHAVTMPDLTALQQQEQGNLTAFLDWSQGTEHRHWSWAERTSDPKLAAPLQRAYVAALAAVASAHR